MRGWGGDWWLFSIKYGLAFDPLRGDPRFQELLKKFKAEKKFQEPEGANDLHA